MEAGLRAALGLAAVAAIAAAGACKSSADVAPEAGSSAASPPTHEGTPARLRMVDAPASGQVDAVVKDALARATAEGRTLVVYVGATWCEPCRRFHEAAERGKLDDRFPRLTLLEFDLDRDRERLAAAGYVSRLIPLFALPAADGAASGKQIEGGIKGDGAVDFVAGRLSEMLSE
jgi:thiol-disulfide isomerase/thioredoxin